MRLVDLCSQPTEGGLTETYSALQKSSKIDDAVLFAESQVIDPPILLFQVTGRPGFENEFPDSSLIHAVDVIQIDEKMFVLRIYSQKRLIWKHRGAVCRKRGRTHPLFINLQRRRNSIQSRRSRRRH